MLAAIYATKACCYIRRYKVIYTRTKAALLYGASMAAKHPYVAKVTPPEAPKAAG